MNATTQPDFQGRSAIVTGAGSGIGRAVALALADRGAKVLAVDINAVAAKETVSLSQGEIVAHRADVSQSNDVRDYAAAAASLHGLPTIFFNNAGIEGVHKSIVDTSEEDWLRTLGVNLNGVFWGLKHVLPLMRQAGGGAVVNTGSILSLKAAPDRSDYVVTKHAVLGLTRSAASEVASDGIKVNCICPGPVDTPLMTRSEILVNPEDPGYERSRFEQGAPAGRYATTAEIAELVLFLLRPDITYLTGAAVNIDGGIMAV